MQLSAQHCAVTGANGYVGSRITEYFASNGWKVFAFARRPGLTTASNQVHVPFQLDSRVDPAVFRDNGIRVLIHCAYDFRPVNWVDIHRVNVEGSTRLLRSAKDGGVDKIIFLSSISAFHGCSSLYGKAKSAIERAAADVGATIIRPGLVYGDRPSGGMFGSLQRLATTSAIIPLIGSGRYKQYLVHEEDLCELLLRISDGEINLPAVPVVAADAHAWQIRDLLQVLSAPRRPNVRFIPLPWRVIWLGLKTSELFGITLPFRSDSVISLVRQNPDPDFSQGAAQMGCRFREFKGSFVGSAR